MNRTAHIIILSAGPSLARHLPMLAGGAPGSVVLAINAAAAMYPADMWIALDDETIRKVIPIGRPRLCTFGYSEPSAYAYPERWQGPALLAEAVGAALSPPAQAMNWSGPTALVIAAHLGAQVIDIYGMDMDGDQNCLGEPDARRSHDRWATERGIIIDVLAWLDQRGVKVRRHKPAMVNCGVAA